ncbi:unnamed protein product [Effrenium voratum]|nr:unnamed protein product [Effrenium voratum]
MELASLVAQLKAPKPKEPAPKPPTDSVEGWAFFPGLPAGPPLAQREAAFQQEPSSLQLQQQLVASWQRTQEASAVRQRPGSARGERGLRIAAARTTHTELPRFICRPRADSGKTPRTPPEKAETSGRCQDPAAKPDESACIDPGLAPPEPFAPPAPPETPAPPEPPAPPAVPAGPVSPLAMAPPALSRTDLADAARGPSDYSAPVPSRVTSMRIPSLVSEIPDDFLEGDFLRLVTTASEAIPEDETLLDETWRPRDGESSSACADSSIVPTFLEDEDDLGRLQTALQRGAPKEKPERLRHWLDTLELQICHQAARSELVFAQCRTTRQAGGAAN